MIGPLEHIKNPFNHFPSSEISPKTSEDRASLNSEGYQIAGRAGMANKMA